MMRKILLHPADYELFDNDITQAEFDFFQRHKDVFKQMFVEQGKDFWVRFVMTFRKFTLQYGIVRNYPKEASEYEDYIDQAFINIHENFVEVRNNQAIRFLLDIVVVAQFRPPEFCNPNTTVNNPFFAKHTRDAYRNLFGDPKDKASYIKVYALQPLFLRFGGSVCQCLRRWRNAPELQPGEEYWTALDDTSTPSRDPPSDADDPMLKLFLLEKLEGHPSGPIHVTYWTPRNNPRTQHKENPLYNPKAVAGEDWREGVELDDFVEFHEWCRLNLKPQEDATNATNATKPGDAHKVAGGASSVSSVVHHEHCKLGGVIKKSVKKKKRSGGSTGSCGGHECNVDVPHVHITGVTDEAEVKKLLEEKSFQDELRQRFPGVAAPLAIVDQMIPEKKGLGEQIQKLVEARRLEEEKEEREKEKKEKEKREKEKKEKEKREKEMAEAKKLEEEKKEKEKKIAEAKKLEEKKKAEKKPDEKKEKKPEPKKVLKVVKREEKKLHPHELSDEELANNPWIKLMEEYESQGMGKAEALIAATMNRFDEENPLYAHKYYDLQAKEREAEEKKLAAKMKKREEEKKLAAKKKEEEELAAKKKKEEELAAQKKKDEMQIAMKAPGEMVLSEEAERELREATIARATEGYIKDREEEARENPNSHLKPPGERPDPFRGMLGGSFKFLPKKEGQARFSKAEAADKELERDLVAKVDSQLAIPIDPNTDFSKVEIFDRNALLQGIKTQGRELDRPRSLSSNDLYDSFDAEHVGQISMYCQNLVMLAARENKSRRATITLALKQVVHCEMTPHAFNTVVMRELPHAPVPLAEEFWDANLLRLQEALISKETSMPAVPDPSLLDLHLKHVLVKMNKPVGFPYQERARECRFFFRLLMLYAKHNFGAARHSKVTDLIQTLVDDVMTSHQFVEKVAAMLEIDFVEAWVPFLDGLVPSFRTALLMIEVDLQGIRLPPKDRKIMLKDYQVPPGERCFDFLNSLLRLSTKMHTHNLKIRRCIQGLVDDTTSFSEFAADMRSMMDEEGFKEISEIIQNGLPEVRLMLLQGICSLPGIEPPPTQPPSSGPPSRWIEADRMPNPGSPLAKILELMESLLTIAESFHERLLKFLQITLNFLLEDKITSLTFTKTIHALIPNFAIPPEVIAEETIDPGLQTLREYMLEGRILIRDVRPPTGKRDGRDEATKTKEREADGEKLLQSAKELYLAYYMSHLSTKAIEASLGSDDDKTPDEKGDGKKQLALEGPKTSTTEKKKKKTKKATKTKDTVAVVADVPKPYDRSPWTFVRDLGADGIDPRLQDAEQQGKTLATYLDKMLEKCRSKKNNPHLIDEAERLVQAYVEDTIPEELFFFQILHIAFDHDEEAVGKQLNLVHLMKGGADYLRNAIRGGRVNLVGMGKPYSDEGLYYRRYGTRPLTQFRMGEYCAMLKAEYDPDLLEYVSRKGMVMKTPNLENLPGVSMEACEAAMSRVVTREPGVGHQVELYARYLATMAAEARIQHLLDAMLHLITWLATSDKDVAKPYYPRNYLRDLDRLAIVPFGSHAHFLPFLNRAHEGFVEALASSQIYMQDLEPSKLIDLKTGYAIRNNLPLPNAQNVGAGIFDKTKNNITRQPEPPMTRPSVSGPRGQTLSDMLLCVEYFKSLIAFVESKPAAVAAIMPDATEAGEKSSSPDMQKAILLAKMQDLVDDTLLAEHFIGNVARMCEGDGIHHHNYVSFIKKALVPLRKAMLAKKVTIPGILPPRTDDQLYEAQYLKPPSTPFKPDEFKRSLRAPKSSDCPWEEAEPDLHDLPSIKPKMVTEGKSRVRILKSVEDGSVLKTAMYLGILVSKVLDAKGTEHCESMRRLQEVMDGFADVQDVYNCMEAEDILVGKTHDNYAIFFQSQVWELRQCVSGGLLEIEGLRPPATDAELYERIYHRKPLVIFLKGEFQDYLRKLRSGMGVVTAYQRRRDMRVLNTLVTTARDLLEKLPTMFPAEARAAYVTLTQKLVDDTIHAEEYLKEVEALMPEPLPTVGWYWPYVPILEVCMPALRDALSTKQEKMVDIVPPRTAEELIALRKAQGETVDVEPDEFKASLRAWDRSKHYFRIEGDRAVPFKPLPDGKKSLTELVVSAKKKEREEREKQGQLLSQDPASEKLFLHSYLFVSTPIGFTLARFLEYRLSEDLHGKLFDEIYEAACMGLVEVARHLLQETAWMSEREKQTKMKELMRDACCNRYNVKPQIPPCLMYKDGSMRVSDNEMQAKDLLCDEVATLNDEEAMLYANYINTNAAIEDVQQRYPEYTDRYRNYKAYLDKREHHRFVKGLAKKANDYDKSLKAKDATKTAKSAFKSAYNMESLPPEPHSKAISQLLCRQEGYRDNSVQNLGPCLRPTETEGVECWHTARDGSTVWHYVECGTPQGTTTLLTPVDSKTLKWLPEILEKLEKDPGPSEDPPPEISDLARARKVRILAPPPRQNFLEPYQKPEKGKGKKGEDAVNVTTFTASKVPPTSDKIGQSGKMAADKTATSKGSSGSTTGASKNDTDSTNRSTYGSTNRSTNQSTKDSTNDSTNRSTNGSTTGNTNGTTNTSGDDGTPKRSSKAPVHQAHVPRDPGALTTARVAGVAHGNVAAFRDGAWCVPIGPTSVLKLLPIQRRGGGADAGSGGAVNGANTGDDTNAGARPKTNTNTANGTTQHKPQPMDMDLDLADPEEGPVCSLCSVPLPPATWIVDVENFLDEEPENAGIRATGAEGEVPAHCSRCRCVAFMLQRHHLLILLSHIYSLTDMQQEMLQLVKDAELCSDTELIPTLQMKMARMSELRLTPDHFPHWELQLSRRIFLLGDLHAWLRTHDHPDALSPQEYIRKDVENVAEFVEPWKPKELSEYFYDKVGALSVAFREEGMSWLRGEGGEVLEALYRRYHYSMPAARNGFHMGLPEVASLDNGSRRLRERIRPIMSPPLLLKTPKLAPKSTKNPANTPTNPSTNPSQTPSTTPSTTPSSNASTSPALNPTNPLSKEAHKAAVKASEKQPSPKKKPEEKKKKKESVKPEDAVKSKEGNESPSGQLSSSSSSLAPSASASASSASSADVSRTLRHCSRCQNTEPKPRAYKKCQKCKEMGLKNARYYCSKECQVTDWNARHKMEHKEGMLVA